MAKEPDKTVLIPYKLHKALKATCEDRGMTIKAFIVKAVEKFMSKKV